MRAYVLLIIALLMVIAVSVNPCQKPIEKPLLVTAQPASMIICDLRSGDDALKHQRAQRIVKT